MFFVFDGGVVVEEIIILGVFMFFLGYEIVEEIIIVFFVIVLGRIDGL